MTNILDIPDQQFYVWDRVRHEAARDGLEFLSGLEKEDDDQKRDELEKRIQPAVGFRQAEKLRDAKPEEVREVLQSVRERQIQMKAYLEERFETAASRINARFPEDFGEQEVRRNAVFHTLSRSGTILIADSFGQRDWEEISDRVRDGNQLDNYLPREIVENILDLLPYALVFNKQRAELKDKLRSYLTAEQLENLDRKLPKLPDLPEEANQMVERCIKSEVDFEKEFAQLASNLKLSPEKAEELENRLKKVVQGSVRLARSLDGLRFGRADEEILDPPYRTKSRYKWFGLGKEIAGLRLAEYDIDHVHTRNSRYVASIIASWLSGKGGLPTKLLEYLGIEDVSSWHTRQNKFLDPVLEPDPETLGLYTGHFLFGNGFMSGISGYYSPKDKRREWFLNLLERAGRLEEDLSIQSTTSGKIAKRFSIQIQNPDKVVEMYIVPVQIFRLAKYAIERCQDEGFYRAALRGWLVDRYSQFSGQKGGLTRMKKEYEDKIKEMASAVGLNLSRWGDSNQRRSRVYVNNPEVVGYRADLVE